MKYFSVPGYFTHANEIKMLIEYMKKYPDQFEEDRILDSAFDFPADSIWNGGRVSTHMLSPFQQREILVYYFTQTNIKLAHTCTNMLIDFDLAKDWKSNLFLKCYNRPEDSIIVASNDLYSYLKTAYPEMHYILSTTLEIIDTDEINKIIEENDMMVVINYRYNNDNNYLDKIQNKDKIEIICAEPCEFFCNCRKKHYEDLSKEQLGLVVFDDENFASCPYNVDTGGRIFAEIQQLPHAITNERINELANKGITHFKISGRSLPFNQWFDTVIYYLAKPEYRELIIQRLTTEVVLRGYNYEF